MHLRNRALAISALCTLLAAGIALWLASRLTRSAQLEVVYPAGVLEGVPRGVPPAGANHATHYLSEREAGLLFALRTGTHEYDPFVYYRYVGNLHSELSLNADGRTFVHHTSSDGYREDFQTLPSKRDTFVLVVGDSHAEGLCSNHESFANLAEGELRAQRVGASVEVLNAGVSGYSFYNYAGCLEKHLPLRPNAFVAVVYGGSDFKDVLAPWHRFHGIAAPSRDREYWNQLLAATNEPSLLGNALQQLFDFHLHPEHVDEARRAVRETVAHMARTCKEHGISFVLVYLPMNVERNERRGGEIRSALTTLGIGSAAFRAVDALADEALAVARGGGGSVLDLRTVFTEDVDRYYWHDLHLSAHGHATLARHLVPILERVLPKH